MAKRIKLALMRGYVIVLKALLRSWHADWVLAAFAVLLALVTLILVGVALWVMSGAVAHLLHAQFGEFLFNALVALFLMVLAKISVSAAKWLLPLSDTQES